MISPSTFRAVCEELDLRRQITMGLERMHDLLRALGNPEHDLSVVQVVGTNGKGTTAVALAAAAEEMGCSAGAYLSPHVLSYTERMMVHDAFVSEEVFASLMGEVMAVADAEGIPASQFELLTAGALKLFRDSGLSLAVLEAGLGARHDATTAAAPETVVLTNVSLDHTEYLGETVAEISREKLASLRAGSALILGTEDPVVARVARESAAKIGARIIHPPSGARPSPSDGQLALHLARNAHLGITAAEEVVGRRLDVDGRTRVADQVAGLSPARFEVREVRGTPVVVDGGHNPAGLRATLDAVREVYGGRPMGLVFGALRDKDVASMLTALEREASLLVLTRPANERAAEPEWIQRSLDPRDREGRRARVVEEAGDALGMVVEEMSRVDGVVLVTGSLYTAGAVLGGLREG